MRRSLWVLVLLGSVCSVGVLPAGYAAATVTPTCTVSGVDWSAYAANGWVASGSVACSGLPIDVPEIDLVVVNPVDGSESVAVFLDSLAADAWGGDAPYPGAGTSGVMLSFNGSQVDDGHWDGRARFLPWSWSSVNYPAVGGMGVWDAAWSPSAGYMAGTDGVSVLYSGGGTTTTTVAGGGGGGVGGGGSVPAPVASAFSSTQSSGSWVMLLAAALLVAVVGVAVGVRMLIKWARVARHAS